MGMPPRLILPDFIISTTQRTVDRQLLFKPGPFIRNLVGASAARAQRRYPVKIFWLEYNINHEQSGIGPVDHSPQAATDVVLFRKLFHQILAVELNIELGREGAVFSSRSRDIHCVDNESAENQYFYALTNPVKDGLCDRIKHWEGFSTYAILAEGRSETYRYYNRTAWNRAGGKRLNKPLEDFEETIELEFSPLPAFENLTVPQRQTRIRRRVREMEQAFREQRQKERRFAMTRERLAKIDPRDRPKTPAVKRPRPLCHASTGASRKRFEKGYREFRQAHRQASIAYLQGNYNVEFPRGSFRPPLIVAAA